MRYFKIAIFLTFIYLPNEIKAQGEANNWYFGQNAGLDFNNGSPVAITDGLIDTFEGTAVISDSSGQLLFYTDGTTVWNRNHDTLQNGFGLLGEQSSTQAALIIPKPGSNNIYYIFTTAQAQRFEDWNFCYTEVDMNLDAGLGGVTTNKNVILFEPIAEKITAVKHANGQDIWVLTHDKFTNKYLTYAVTGAGINSTPIIFIGGSTDNGVENAGFPFVSPNFGQLKASTDGSKIACAFSKANKVDVLNFNNATGQLTFRFTINQIINPYGVEFSPNNNLLYITGYSPTVLKQYNLTLTSPSTIISSSLNIPNINGYSPWSLQLGPDEKIYSANAVGTSIDCIQNPNQVGLACNYSVNAVSLNGKQCWLGLPNFFPYFVVPSGIEHIGSCPNDTTFFAFLNGVQADSVLWNFGDPNSGILNTTTSLTPFHIYQNAGTYIVSVTTFQGSVSNTVSKPVTIFPVPSISLGPDIEFCDVIPDIGVLNPDPSYSYSWTFEYQPYLYTTPSIFIYATGNYTVTASNNCGTATDTILVNRISPPVNFDLGADVTFCEGNQVYLSTENQPDVDYLWQDGSTEPVYTASSTGAYILQLSNICGTASDTLIVTVNPLPVISLGNDTLFCNGETLQISPTGVFDAYVWQNGLLNESLTINTTGIYYAYATNVCGQTIDSINVTQIAAPNGFDFGSGLSFCEGSPFILNASQANVTYQWQDGSTDSVYIVTQSGTYSVTLINQCGSASDTTFVTVNPLPTVSLGPDIIVCSGNPIQLNATGNAGSYYWPDASTNSFFIVDTSGTYLVFAFNNCGVASDTITVNFGVPTVNSINLIECEPIVVNGVTYANSGQFIQVLQNSSGCDSILTINAEILNFTAQITQQGSTLIFNGNPTSIQWINCTTGQAIPGATQTSFTPQVSGNYGAVITIGECVDTSNCLQFIKPVEIQFPSICETIVLSPNPVIDNLQFNLNKNSYPLNLFSSTGALVKSWTGNDQTQMVFFSELATAVYILQIDSCYFKVVKN